MSAKGLGAGFGLILVAGACGMLVWNESRSVSVQDALRLGEREVRTVTADRIDPANEGKLVFVRGMATGGPIVDPDTGVRLEALAAQRKVEMYQWRERDTARRGGSASATMDASTLSLTRTWSERAEPTTIFMQAQRLANPPMPFGERRFTAEGARLGAFGLTAEALSALPKQPAPVAAEGLVAGRPATPAGEALLVGFNPQQPEIGDLRIAYTAATPGEVSLVGRQVDGAVAAHTTADGERILLAASGLRSPQDMFGAAQSGNTVMTWATRVFGGLVMWGGFALLLRRLTLIGELIPVVGGLLASGSRAVAFAAAALVSTLVIAGGWLLARPVALLVVAALLAAGLWLRRGRGQGPTPAEAGAQAAARMVARRPHPPER